LVHSGIYIMTTYRLDQMEREEPKASQRTARKRTKYAVGSSKAQAQRALGEIDTSLLPSVERASSSESGGEATGYYRSSLQDYKESMPNEKASLPQGYETVIDADKDIDVDPDIISTGDPLSIIREFEGYREKAYWDVDHWAIGYGSKASGEDASITKEEAEAKLKTEFNKFRSMVVDHREEHGYNWQPHQVDALTIFAYNIGSIDSLTEDGTRGDGEISEMILEYNKMRDRNGKLVTAKGLTKRRQAEAKLFTQGYES